ncbi:uncharacterized protein PSFLO_00017 [Pseudozyma flocculosa]|uniref:Uncharacterized protein n=1 Tax=Pseudozyma flocculosa TaxID=84751 RepID=A0A5C3ESR9_9BASI|nr:uncharacterized protein PSFLO_00017 [Pseudozyma flocculosa]
MLCEALRGPGPILRRSRRATVTRRRKRAEEEADSVDVVVRLRRPPRHVTGQACLLGGAVELRLASSLLLSVQPGPGSEAQARAGDGFFGLLLPLEPGRPSPAQPKPDPRWRNKQGDRRLRNLLSLCHLRQPARDHLRGQQYEVLDPIRCRQKQQQQQQQLAFPTMRCTIAGQPNEVCWVPSGLARPPALAREG